MARGLYVTKQLVPINRVKREGIELIVNLVVVAIILLTSILHFGP